MSNVQTDWEAAYRATTYRTTSTRLRHFLFKFLHGIITTNSVLYKIKIIDTNVCSFCANCEETIIHLYWECRFTVIFPLELIDFLMNCSVIAEPHTYRNPSTAFLMVIMASGIARGRDCTTTTTTTTTSHNN